MRLFERVIMVCFVDLIQHRIRFRVVWSMNTTSTETLRAYKAKRNRKTTGKKNEICIIQDKAKCHERSSKRLHYAANPHRSRSLEGVLPRLGVPGAFRGVVGMGGTPVSLRSPTAAAPFSSALWISLAALLAASPTWAGGRS